MQRTDVNTSSSTPELSMNHPATPMKPLRETYAGKHLVVTGTTGFLGKVWLAMVLDFLPEVGHITLLIRGKKGESADERFTRIFEASPAFRPLRDKLGQELRALIADKVTVKKAALTEPLCGFSESEAKELMANVDAVVHFAGLTDFEPDPQWSIDANIHGAAHVADLAALSPKHRYVHVSTTFVGGMRNGEIAEVVTPGISPNGTRFDPSEELRICEAEIAKLETKKERIDLVMARAQALGWPNIYTYSKGLSEHLIDLRTDVVTTTYRPAIVECARNYPFQGWNEGINTSGPIVWLLSTSFQRFPAKATNNFDIVPVDTVARTMVMVTGRALEDTAQHVYQCASGHQNPFTFERAVDLCGIAIRRMHKRTGNSVEKNFTAYLDSHCADPTKTEVLGFRRMQKAAKATRSFLRSHKLERYLSPSLFEKIDGKRIQKALDEVSKEARSTDRILDRVDGMLRQYRPFIHDYNYTFLTDNLVIDTQMLAEEDRERFGFDIHDICWRDYWMNTQVPGLEKWSLPLMRNEKVPDDPPLPRLGEEKARRTGEFVIAGQPTPANETMVRAS